MNYKEFKTEIDTQLDKAQRVPKEPMTTEQTKLFNSIMAGLEVTQIIIEARGLKQSANALTEDIEKLYKLKELIEGGDHEPKNNSNRTP